MGNRARCGFPKTCGNRPVVSMGLAASTACLSPPRASAAPLCVARARRARESHRRSRRPRLWSRTVYAATHHGCSLRSSSSLLLRGCSAAGLRRAPDAACLRRRPVLTNDGVTFEGTNGTPKGTVSEKELSLNGATSLDCPRSPPLGRSAQTGAVNVAARVTRVTPKVTQHL